MGLLKRIKNAPKRWSNRVKNRSFDGRDKLKVKPPKSEPTTTKDKRQKSNFLKSDAANKALRIGAAIAEAAGGTDHAKELASSSAEKRNGNGNGNGNGKKKKKKDTQYSNNPTD
jgi:hypothetical protein